MFSVDKFMMTCTVDDTDSRWLQAIEGSQQHILAEWTWPDTTTATQPTLVASKVMTWNFVAELTLSRRQATIVDHWDDVGRGLKSPSVQSWNSAMAHSY